MRLDLITLFPEMAVNALQYGVVGRALENHLWDFATWNPRDFVHDLHRTVDDRPFGGGPGMVMMAQPLSDAIAAAKAAQRDAKCEASRVIVFSPSGEKLVHKKVVELSTLASNATGLILIAGRYEGIDERLLETEVDEQISIGDFVVSGGELPALMLIDAIVRRIPGALHDDLSAVEESFVDGLLDYPQYTRPPEFRGKGVPEVLLTGHHANIAEWRLAQSLLRTAARRPDLLETRGVTDAERKLMKKYS